MKYILGIDIGTGSTKAVALDFRYQPVGSCQQHYSTFSLLPGYSEQDPEAIWMAFVECINEMVNKMGAAPQVIGLSSAMHSVIAVDAAGAALAPMMTWADARSADIAEQMRATDAGMKIYEATGTPIHAMSPLCKLIWLRENQQKLFDAAYKFISIKEYIWYRLFDEYRIDHSVASCMGLFDLESLGWNADALQAVKIDPARLSELVGTDYTMRGLSYDAAMLFGVRDVPFVIGASDGCLANLGSHATELGVAAITIGTSGAVRVASRKPTSNPSMTFSYVLDEQTYICGGPVNNGGIVLQWLLKNVFGKETSGPEDYDNLFKLIKSIPAGSEGLICLPYLNGERAPVWDASASGSFFGLRLQHGQGHLARAVLEGVCYALNQVLVTLEQYAGHIHQINVSGGFVHSEVWMQLLADVTGKPLLLMHTEDASAIGAAYLAVKAADLTPEYPRPVLPEKTIVPDGQTHNVYKKGFATYSQLYPALKDLT
ncbi:gluconokinase [Pedobacter ginsengisoli]|uniref:gluconokinase n=1 Tax=Pedobacter ginsengisoli TaxID=363852 RepID=UPI00254C9109|nr:gluconokinase [Pedobacter ginsengisoli]